jgi:hypothetical protein
MKDFQENLRAMNLANWREYSIARYLGWSCLSGNVNGSARLLLCEAGLQKDRNREEYREVIHNMLEESNRLTHLMAICWKLLEWPPEAYRTLGLAGTGHPGKISDNVKNINKCWLEGRSGRPDQQRLASFCTSY